MPGTSGHGALLMVSISDGTSNTFLAGEDLPQLNRWSAWPYANAATATCAIPLNNALLPGQPGYNNSADWPDVYSFRSRHTNGANFAMADGSVHFITNDIDRVLYMSLATAQGQESVSPP